MTYTKHDREAARQFERRMQDQIEVDAARYQESPRRAAIRSAFAWTIIAIWTVARVAFALMLIGAIIYACGWVFWRAGQ